VVGSIVMLTNLEITNAKTGMHADGNGLYLSVSEGGQKGWVFRYLLNGKRRVMSLGSLKDLTVTKARAEAEDLKATVRKKRDPLELRAEARRKAEEEAKAAAREEVITRATFKTVAEEYIRSHSPGWKNAKHGQQWTNTLATYVYPTIGKLPINQVETSHVINILEPIWKAKPETASRVRSRMELIISYAKAREWFESANPAVWRGHLSALLPATSKIREVKHHAALPWDRMPQFMCDLKLRQGSGARALEFLILTATRSGEVRGATWSEIDLKGELWTIPASRMKAGKEHRVPLSAAAVALLKALPQIKNEPLLFPGTKARRVLSDMSLSAVLKRMDLGKFTVHGFRSTFRDWAAEKTFHHPDIVEMALAHTVANKVEAAYRRGELLEKRKPLMQDWAEWCGSPTFAPNTESLDKEP